MIFNLLLSLVATGPAWFGPGTVDQTLSITGNPFDSAHNDVRAVFSQPGHRYERLAYYGKGKWHATLSAPVGGKFQVQFFLNGKKLSNKPTFVALHPAQDSEFVRLNGKRFKLSSGKPYIPFGLNLAWQYDGAPGYSAQLADMAKAGLNWTRIWTNRWDGKSPFIPKDSSKQLKLGWLNEPAFDRWDSIVEACEKNRIKFQFVLFHHGLFSTTTDPNWSEHPWNTANGGFLSDPTDYFVNPIAKKLTKNWLRYAVARWGHSTSVMAWELFNEVQWVDAAKKHPERIGDVVAWHREMAEFMRSLDPYHHLVTSSSSEELDPRVFERMDYLQPHSYPPNLFAAILGAPAPKDKPSFFGEFGVHFETVNEQVAIRALRDGFWAALLANQAGPAQYWYWEEAYKYHLYDEYAREAKTLARIGFADNPDAVPVTINVSGGVPNDLTVNPGIGWGATTKFVYDLPVDAPTGSLATLSTFIQSKGSHNRDLMREPIRLRFNALSDGTARIVVGEMSKAGARLNLSLNDALVADKAWPAESADHVVDQEFLVSFKAGPNEIQIENSGTDWFKLKSVAIPNLGSGVLAAGAASSHYCLMRLQWVGGLSDSPKSVKVPGLADGKYEMRQFDIRTGKEMVSEVAVSDSDIKNYFPLRRMRESHSSRLSLERNVNVPTPALYNSDAVQPKVLAVSSSSTHTFSKKTVPEINLIAGLGVEGDAHCGSTVKHRSRVAANPDQPNLRQVHLIHSELLKEVAKRGFHVNPGDLGENITTVDIDLLSLPKGTWLHIGEQAILEITGLRNPCGQIDNFQPGLLAAVLDKDEKGELIRKSGIMAVVKVGGVVRPEDIIAIELPPEPHQRLERV